MVCLPQLKKFSFHLAHCNRTLNRPLNRSCDADAANVLVRVVRVRCVRDLSWCCLPQEPEKALQYDVLPDCDNRGIRRTLLTATWVRVFQIARNYHSGIDIRASLIILGQWHINRAIEMSDWTFCIGHYIEIENFSG